MNLTGGAAIKGEDAIAKEIRNLDGVTSVTPEIDTRVMIAYKGRVLAPVILGVEADEFMRAYKVGEPVAGERFAWPPQPPKEEEKK